MYTQNHKVYPLQQSQHSSQDLEGFSNTYFKLPSCLLSLYICLLFSPLFTSLGREHNMEKHQKWVRLPEFSSPHQPHTSSLLTLSLHPYLHPVSIHLVEENTERVRLGSYISVQQAGCSDGQLHPSDAVLRCNAAGLALRGRAQSVGHGLRLQLMPLKTRSIGLNKYSFLTCYRKYETCEVALVF